VQKYEIVRVIGRGGMGTVYEALNTAIGKRVAMKFIDAAAVHNADAAQAAGRPTALTEAVARFQREAQAASAVESAHIVDIFDSGISDEGQPYIVMELLRGEDLGHRIKRCGRLDLAEALHVTAQILRGLNRAHKSGIIHRDLKPDNIFLVDRDDDPNFAKILDFGISKVRRQGETPLNTLTRQGTVLGTPFYMSPEQAQAQPDVDARSDLWSVGAILYECLTGRPPYTGVTYEQVIVNICMNDADDVRVYNPAVPEPVAHVIAQALARDREDRFQSAREFLDSLRAAAGAGGAISSRGGLISNDDSVVSSSEPPVSAGRTPSTPSGSRRPPAGDPALDATLRYHATPPDGSGRSTLESRRQPVARQRRMFVLVAVSALLAGCLLAVLVAPAMRSADRRPVAVPPAYLETSKPPETTAAPPPVVVVPSAAPVIEPAPPPAETVDAKSKVQKVVHVNPPPPALPPGETPKPTVSGKTAPKVPETATPPTSGVAPGLKLKTE
jgi:serine/threonine-protein kinase